MLDGRVSAESDIFFVGVGDRTYVLICRMGVPDSALCLIFVSIIANFTYSAVARY
jgi:hypothetical protein